MFVLPPTNHLTAGTRPDCSFFHGRSQTSSSAMFCQNVSGSSAACFRSFLYSRIEPTRADEENSAGGGNCRVSIITEVIEPSRFSGGLAGRDGFFAMEEVGKRLFGSTEKVRGRGTGSDYRQ